MPYKNDADFSTSNWNSMLEKLRNPSKTLQGNNISFDGLKFEEQEINDDPS